MVAQQPARDAAWGLQMASAAREIARAGFCDGNTSSTKCLDLGGGIEVS